MTLGDALPTVNACLNGASAALVLSGGIAIRARRIAVHRACMLGAFGTSAVFLLTYLTRVYLTGTHRYPGTGWPRTLYLVILLSHMLLAVATVPLVLRTLRLARSERFAEHRAIARFTWPVWLYVSVTGVVVYLMLYHLA